MTRKKTDSKSEILDAAAECFMEMGTEVASVSDIARRLGATKGRVYHHFASKGALLSGVRMRAIQTMTEELEAVTDFDLPAPVNFHKMATQHVLALLESLPYHKVDLQKYNVKGEKYTTAYERELLEEIETARDAYGEMFRKVILQGIESGEFRKMNVSIVLHSVLILLNSPVFWFSPRSEDPDAERALVAKELADMALYSLLPRTSQ